MSLPVPDLHPSLGRGVPVLAVDIGGTDTKSALVTADGDLVDVRRTATPSGSVDALRNHLVSLRDAHRARHPDVAIERLGLTFPGIVDEDAGVSVNTSNLGLKGVPLRTLAQEWLGLPTVLRHDVRAAGDAERLIGAARGHDDAVVVAIGTGIAAAVFVGGRPYAAGGYAGEVGHQVIDPAGPACVCGLRGCLESIASAGAIARRYRELSGDERVTRGSDVHRLVRAGDEFALAVWRDAVDALGLALSQVTAMLAPTIVVVAGGLSRAGDDLFVPLRTRVDGNLSFHRRPLIVPAVLGGDAGLLGVALAARASG